MPRSYAPHFRAMVIEQVRSSRPVLTDTVDEHGADALGGDDGGPWMTA